MDWTTCVAFSPAAQQLTDAASEQTSSHHRPGEGGAGKGVREEGSKRGSKDSREEGGCRNRDRREVEEEGGWRKIDYICQNHVIVHIPHIYRRSGNFRC